jgi:hypothetical protein
MKISVNEDCPCGSKKKMKNCCLPGFRRANSNILYIRNKIRGLIYEQLANRGLIYEQLANRGLKEAKLDQKEEKPYSSTIIYSLNKIPALKVNFSGVTLNLKIWHDCVRMAEYNPNDLKYKFIKEPLLMRIRRYFSRKTAKGEL